MLSREHHGPRAVLNALERLAGGYATECARVRQDLVIAEAQLRDYQARLDTPFPHDSYLSGLTALRDQLKAGLSGVAPESGAEPLPAVSDLAARIKALKAAHTIAATPERVGKRRYSAEEPVTARIRRRTEAISASDPAVEQEAAKVGLVPVDARKGLLQGKQRRGRDRPGWKWRVGGVHPRWFTTLGGRRTACSSHPGVPGRFPGGRPAAPGECGVAWWRHRRSSVRPRRTPDASPLRVGFPRYANSGRYQGGGF